MLNIRRAYSLFSRVVSSGFYLRPHTPPPVWRTAAKMSSSGRPGVALFGFGRMGRIHLDTLLGKAHLIQLRYLVDDLCGPLQEAKARFRLHDTDVRTQADTAAVLADPKVDGVIICTPTNTHFPLIMAALEAGKNVMCEKPIGMDLMEVRDCYRKAEEKGKVLLCALNRRFDPVYESMREKVKDGSLGRLQFAQSFVRDHPAPDPSVLANLGNIVLDMAIHGIDTLMYVTGERPHQVATFAHGQEAATRARKDFDAFALLLKFPSGLMAYVDSCRYAPYGYDQRMESALVAETPKEGTLVSRTPEGDRTEPMLFSFPQRFAEAYKAELVHFLRILMGEETCRVPGAEVIASTMAVMAAEKSAKTNRIVDIHYDD